MFLDPLSQLEKNTYCYNILFSPDRRAKNFQSCCKFQRNPTKKKQYFSLLNENKHPFLHIVQFLLFMSFSENTD